MSPVTSRIAPLAVLLLLAAAAPTWAQSQIVSSEEIEPTAEDFELPGPHFSLNFGAALALAGRIAAVGIPYDTEGGPGAGRVGLYSETKAGWIRSATLTPSNASDIRFGRDVDLCRNLVMVAAENSTYVFQRHGTQWREVKRIELQSPGSTLAAFACSENAFAQGVVTSDDQGQLVAGRVYVYERQHGSRFELVATLRGSDPNDSIGRSLAMERGVLVAGSLPDAAYVFKRHGHRWIERQKLQSTGPGGAGIGAAVAIRDRVIIAGAPGVNFPGGEPPFSFAEGDAFVYLPYRGSWFESQSLNPLGSPLFNGAFGSNVAMGRRLAAVSAPLTDAEEIRPESNVIVFDRIGEEFTFGRRVFGAGFDDQRIPDIDMSGRRLILSVHESRRQVERIVGRVVVLEFEAAPDAAQMDEEEADELLD